MDLVTSDFVRSKSDDELVQYVQTGRPVDSPDNRTGIAMPPKGGNPALTEEQIRKIIAYLRTIHV